MLESAIPHNKPDKRKALTGKEFLSHNLPGTDTFDDGLDVGELKMPGSTSTESGGMYMEHKGPNNLVYKPEDGDKAEIELHPGLNLVESHELKDSTDDGKGDDADEWLRKNDPNYGK